MMNFNEGQDYLLIHGLAGLPTASTLYLWLSTKAEADTTPAATFAGNTVTRIGTTVVTAGSLTSSSRIIDLGAADFSAETSGLAKSVVVTTVTPGGASPLLLAIQDLNAGAAINLASANGVIVDDLSIEYAYLVSGSVA